MSSQEPHHHHQSQLPPTDGSLNANNGHDEPPQRRGSVATVFEPVSIRNPSLGVEINGNIDDAALEAELEEFFEMMKDEKARLRTYSIVPWPVPFIKPVDLAKAGFFYLTKGDKVQCAYCRNSIERWEPNDVPILEHMKHYPRCPFILNLDVNNGPVDHSVSSQSNGTSPISSTSTTSSISPRDVCGNHHHGSTSPIPTAHNANRVYSVPFSNEDLVSMGIQRHTAPQNPNFVTLESRIESFNKNWTGKDNLSPEKVAEAGFFYIGVDDYVKCFNCDGGLYNWKLTDDPWIEHARYFPDCHFVSTNKGQAFVESARQLYGDKIPATTSEDDDALTVKAVDGWFNSDLVQKVLAEGKQDVNIVKATLYRRWIEKQIPFATKEELLKSIEALKNPRGGEDVPPVRREPSPVQNGISQVSTSSSTSGSQLETPTEGRDERLLCKICFDRNVGVVFLPCGHTLACTQCAPGLSNCPVCRRQIMAVCRTFFS